MKAKEFDTLLIGLLKTPKIKTMKQNTITELEALQNFGDDLGLTIHEKYPNDKRNTIKKYFAALDGVSVSPVLDYEQLNCFMIGWKNRETKGVYHSPATKEQAPDSSTPVLENDLFTGGNWIVDERNGKLFIEAIGERDGEKWGATIAQMYGTEKEDRNDSRLIAEAKNMYYALKDLAERFDEICNDLGLRVKDEDSYVNAKAIINRINNTTPVS